MTTSISTCRHPARIGTAGWSIPRAEAEAFPGEGTHLARYARRFDAVEINTSFYRPHRAATYARWAASVPDGFRFAVKLPRAITHERRLVGCDEPLARFADEIAPLDDKQGPVLIQLPPSLAFDALTAAPFFAAAQRLVRGPLVCEPRHPSWFTEEGDALLADHRIALVAADPARVVQAASWGGWPNLRYTRLHGSPIVYRSTYDYAAITRHAEATCAAGTESWTIFDNTAAGAAIGNALAMLAAIGDRRGSTLSCSTGGR